MSIGSRHVVRIVDGVATSTGEASILENHWHSFVEVVSDEYHHMVVKRSRRGRVGRKEGGVVADVDVVFVAVQLEPHHGWGVLVDTDQGASASISICVGAMAYEAHESSVVRGWVVPKVVIVDDVGEKRWQSGHGCGEIAT